MTLNFVQLKQLVAGDTVALRGAATLEPAGGAGDKIFPPTHAVDDKNKKPGAKYAFETRRIGGRINVASSSAMSPSAPPGTPSA